jgi:hypothetical protein
VRILAMVSVIASAAPVFAQVRVEVTAPPPPRVVVSAPPPPRVVVAPPPRVVVAPPPPVVVAPPAVRVAAPTVRFEAPPPMVVVQPGVQVVQDCDDEVFFTSGWYWHRGPNGWWYRTHSYRGGWVAVPPRHVPGMLVRLPPGHYRHWRAEHEARKEERRWEKQERKEEKHEARWENRGRGKHGRW